MISIIFFAVTFGVVIFTERVEGILLRKLFRGYLENIKKTEEKIEECYFYSILAVVAKDYEAYKGFQQIMNEMYWLIFFRRVMFNMSFFFILLTPYMLFTYVFLNDVVPNSFSWVVFIAVLYFTAKLGYNLIRESINTWRAANH
uniref:Uncharacterized protein n=1 Tax=Geoglobus ahangari TaxID=113653 RepID=A0A7C3YFS8_9EURY